MAGMVTVRRCAFSAGKNAAGHSTYFCYGLDPDTYSYSEGRVVLMLPSLERVKAMLDHTSTLQVTTLDTWVP